MAVNHRRQVWGERHSKFMLGSTLDPAGPAWRDCVAVRFARPVDGPLDDPAVQAAAPRRAA
jgi:hypothetical protein